MTSERWHCVESGAGRPLVLLHGIGMSHHVWLTVLERLASQGRRVLAFDLPGFGRTPVMRRRAVRIEHMAQDLVRVLSQMGIDEPVDIVGNSLGATIALEVARQGGARSVVAISPAGLWPRFWAPPAMLMALGLSRYAPRLLPDLTRKVLRNDTLRAAVLAIPIAADGRKVPPEEAILMAERFAHAPGFWPIALGFSRMNHRDGITAPCTVVYGQKDRMLPAFARDRERLPAHAKWLEPEGWGHVPVWDDPEGVVKLILEHTA